MNHQPAIPKGQTCTCSLRLYGLPVFMNDFGMPILPLSTPDYVYPANEYPRDDWARDPNHLSSNLHVNPGYQSKIEVDGVMDGSPSTGLTSFSFLINYSACNGMRQTDGQEICEAVERLVERMVADRTWRREFGCREDETPKTQQRNGPEAANEEQNSEAADSNDVDAAE